MVELTRKQEKILAAVRRFAKESPLSAKTLTSRMNENKDEFGLTEDIRPREVSRNAMELLYKRLVYSTFKNPTSERLYGPKD